MTIIEAINSIDALKTNAFTQSDKVKWLSRLDWRIKREIIDTHEGESISFSGYDDDTALDTELLAPTPYDEMYLRWMEAQMDYTNGEYNRYNNSITMFNTAYSNYERYYNRMNTPKGKKLKFF